MEKRIDIALLLSFYGPLLTERQRQMLRYYYEDDLSLSEVAELCGVTRQGAHDAIRRGAHQLALLEEKLGLRARWVRICHRLAQCQAVLAGGNTEKAIGMINELLLDEERTDAIDTQTDTAEA